MNRKQISLILASLSSTKAKRKSTHRISTGTEREMAGQSSTLACDKSSFLMTAFDVNIRKTGDGIHLFQLIQFLFCFRFRPLFLMIITNNKWAAKDWIIVIPLLLTLTHKACFYGCWCEQLYFFIISECFQPKMLLFFTCVMLISNYGLRTSNVTMSISLFAPTISQLPPSDMILVFTHSLKQFWCLQADKATSRSVWVEYWSLKCLLLQYLEVFKRNSED